jgi:hypothetical protein
VYIALSKSYDQILDVIGAGTGIVGLAKAVCSSNLYARRHNMIGDAYKDQGINVPNETIDWIFDAAQSKKMPTNGAIAVELAAQKTIPGYKPCALATLDLGIAPIFCAEISLAQE